MQGRQLCACNTDALLWGVSCAHRLHQDTALPPGEPYYELLEYADGAVASILAIPWYLGCPARTWGLTPSPGALAFKPRLCTVLVEACDA